MKKTVFAFLCFAFFLIQCTQDRSRKDENTLEISVKEGEQLARMHCYSCHNPDPDSKVNIAPGMHWIRETYMEKYPDVASFSKNLSDFVKLPRVDQSLMPDAVNKYGLMPKMTFSPQHLQAIAYFIFHKEFRPKEGVNDQRYDTIDQRLLEYGAEMAMKTKSVLGKNLMKALSQRGTVGALDFCSTRAIPLTDSMQQVHNVSIKRVSDKSRNPDNAANEDERAYISRAKQAIQTHGSALPEIHHEGERVVGYYPIVTNKMCLQCHGVASTEVEQATVAKIKEKYPQDRALGYGVNELRGIWVINMPTDLVSTDAQK